MMRACWGWLHITQPHRITGRATNSGTDKRYILWKHAFFSPINSFKHFIFHQKEIDASKFHVLVSVFYKPPPLSRVGRFTAYRMSKTQLKGGRHKEMTPERKLVLGRALAGRKSMGGNTSIHGNGTMGGRRGSKAFFLFFFFTLKNDAFVLPRERKSKDEEGEKKHTSEHLLKKSKFFGEVELCG